MNQQSVIDNLGHPRILVLGDLMLDRYVWGNAGRVSPEAPVLVLSAEDREVRPGGAASAAFLLKALDADVRLAGVMGNDPEGRILSHILTDAGISRRLIVRDSDRITTAKERYMGRAANRHPHQLLRVDYETERPIAASTEDQILDRIAREIPACQAVLISDYAKGLCTPRVLETVIHLANNEEIPIVVDPSREGDLVRYRGATILKPNRAEAAAAAGMPVNSPDDAIRAARFLQREFGFASVLITLDREGMVVVGPGNTATHFTTRARDVSDVTGAGDMVLAVIGLCCADGVDLQDAVQLANVAAGLSVERIGVTPIGRGELAREVARWTGTVTSKLVTLERMQHLAARYRAENRRIVFTNGCFDLIHAGHTGYLQEAAALGDVLIVAINSDDSVASLKGPDRPLIPAAQRAALLSSLACVDHVLVFDDLTPHRLLREIRPDVLVKGGTYTQDEVVGREVVVEYGGEVAVTSAVADLSTTRLIERAGHAFHVDHSGTTQMTSESQLHAD